MKEKYDYIICGAGLSGLILASRIFEDRFFDDKNILLIDKDLKSSVNKTWCFWETGNSVWKDYIVKSWDTVIFKSKGFKKEKSLKNYSYKMIKSKFFLDSIINKIKQANNFDFFQEIAAPRRNGWEPLGNLKSTPGQLALVRIRAHRKLRAQTRLTRHLCH